MSAFRDAAARTISSCAVLFLVVIMAKPASAQEDVIQFLKGALGDVNEKLDDALKRIDQLEKEKTASSTKMEQIEE